ncbi:MAG: alpha/beta hydrolase [Nitrospiria bacterium]
MAGPLQWKEIAPPDRPEGCIICLHGRGTNGEDLMPLAEAFKLPRIRWILPDAPFPFPGLPGGRMWFGDVAGGASGIETSRRLVTGLLDALIRKDRLAPEKIVLLGFSQGAVMSLDTGLRYRQPLGAIAALSGFLAFPEKLGTEKSPKSIKTPILLVHGTDDEVVAVNGSRKARTALQKEGYTVKLQEYRMGHQITIEEIQFVRNRLIGYMGGP